MCHRSVGLIQNAIESRGIATVSVTMKPEITLWVGVPRAGFLRFPLGNPLGEPGKPELQASILKELFALIYRADEPGWVEEMPYRWRRGRVEPDGRAG